MFSHVFEVLVNSLRPSDALCVSKLTTIASDNGLSPRRHQAIIWTNAAILWIWPLGTNFSEILIEIHLFSFKKLHLNMSATFWPLCLGLNVLTHMDFDMIVFLVIWVPDVLKLVWNKKNQNYIFIKHCTYLFCKYIVYAFVIKVLYHRLLFNIIINDTAHRIPLLHNTISSNCITLYHDTTVP